MGEPQEAPIPFVPNQQSGLEELAGGSPVALNITVDSLGAVTRRPGISDYKGRIQSASTESVLALHESNMGKLYAVRQVGAFRRVRLVGASSELDLSNGPGGKLAGTLRPVLAETEDRIVFAGGDLPLQLMTGGGGASLLGGTPPKASHVIASSNRLLLNDLTQFPKLVWFSDISGQPSGGYEAWSVALGPSTGDAQTFRGLQNMEPVLALAQNAEQVMVWGRSRMTSVIPDNQLVYAVAGAQEIGSSAQYSHVKVDQNAAWLDQLRRFVVSDGRTLAPISDPAIQSTLNDMETVDDCFGWRFLHGNTDSLVWTFPTDGRTFVYQKGAGWSQWQAGGTPWGQFPVLCHHRRTSNGDNVVGTTDGRIGLLDPSATTDFGVAFTASVTTGFQDRGTSRAKHCRAVRVTLRRGESGETREPVGFLSWRNDLGEFTPGIPVGFGAPSDKTAVVRFPSVGGTYRHRQWKWTFSGVGQMALASVTEEFEVLGS